MKMEKNLLSTWESSFRKGILKEIKEEGIKFTRENIEAIVAESNFQSRAKKVPTFDNCPYLAMNKPCHPEVKDMNCFLCPCPNYESERLDGGCRINSRKGKIQVHKNLPAGRVRDCSDCCTNHSSKEVRQYIEAHFDKLKKQYDKIEQ